MNAHNDQSRFHYKRTMNISAMKDESVRTRVGFTLYYKLVPITWRAELLLLLLVSHPVACTP